MQIRNTHYFIFGLLIFSFLACSARTNPVALVEPEVSFTDSLDYRGRHMRLYGNDSIHYYWSKIDDSVRILDLVHYIADTIVGNVRNKTFSPDGDLEKVIYHVDTTRGAIHFKSFYASGELSRIAYVRDTLLFDTLGIYKESGVDYMRADFVEEYSRDGTLGSSGYIGYFSEEGHAKGQFDCLGVWKTYNKLGAVTSIETPLGGGSSGHMLQEYFYTNGQLKSSNEQVQVYAGGFSKGYQEYDSLGHKLLDVSNELLYPEWGESYNDTFTVSTSKEYYKNGRVKLLSINKHFAESEECPCGKWIYYNEKGAVVKTERHGDCYDFKVDCDREE